MTLQNNPQTVGRDHGLATVLRLFYSHNTFAKEKNSKRKKKHRTNISDQHKEQGPELPYSETTKAGINCMACYFVTHCTSDNKGQYP